MLVMMAGLALAAPKLPHVLDGTVTVNGDSNVDGTIKAVSEGTTYGTAEIEDGEFNDLLVSEPDNGEFTLEVDGDKSDTTRLGFLALLGTKPRFLRPYSDV